MAVVITWDTQRGGALGGQTPTSSTTTTADGTPPASTGDVGNRLHAKIPRPGCSVEGGHTESDAATNVTVDEIEQLDPADGIRQTQHAAALIGHLTARHLHGFLFGGRGVRDETTASAAPTFVTNAAIPEGTEQSVQRPTTHSKGQHPAENRTPFTVAPAPQPAHVVGSPRDMAGEDRRQTHRDPRRSEAAARAALAGGGYCVLQKFIQSVGASHSTFRCQWAPPRPSRSSHEPSDGEGEDGNRRRGGSVSHPPVGGSLASRGGNRIRRRYSDDDRVLPCGPRRGHGSSLQGVQKNSVGCPLFPSASLNVADSDERSGGQKPRKSGEVGASLSRPEGASACRGGHRVQRDQDGGQVRHDGILGGVPQSQPGVSSSGGQGLLGLSPACETTETDGQQDGGELKQFNPNHVSSSSQSLARKRFPECSQHRGPGCSRLPERPLVESKRRTRRAFLRPSLSSYVEREVASSPQGRSTSSTPALSTGQGGCTGYTTTSRVAAIDVQAKIADKNDARRSITSIQMLHENNGFDTIQWTPNLDPSSLSFVLIPLGKA